MIDKILEIALRSCFSSAGREKGKRTKGQVDEED